MSYYEYRRRGMSPYIPTYNMAGGEDPAYWTSGRGNFGPSYRSDYYHPNEYFHHASGSRGHRPQRAACLAWPTEIPTRLRVTICCDNCRRKLENALRDLDGVHDVSIEGWESAMVTVTGTAKERKILKKAREFSNTAEPWSDSHAENQYRAAHYAYNGHHMH